MDIKRDLYVRAFLLCGAIETNGPHSNILGVITALDLPVGIPSVRIDLKSFIAIERGVDTSPHSIAMTWIDPDEKVVQEAAPFAMPTPEGIASFTINVPIPISWGLWRPGRYRLLLLIDGALAGFCPLDINAVDPASMGLPTIPGN